MIKQGDVLTLNDNNLYAVAFTTELNANHYAYLVNQNDYTHTMFCRINSNQELQEVVEPEIIEQLLKQFLI